MNYKLRESTTLKAISYVLIPVLILIIIMGIGCQIYYQENKSDIKNKYSFYEADTFYYPYINNISQILWELSRGANYLVEYHEQNNVKYMQDPFGRIGVPIKYLIKDVDNNKIYTNYELTSDFDTFEKIHKNIMEQEIYWNYNTINDKIDTNINKGKFSYGYKELFSSSGNYEIYTTINGNDMNELYIGIEKLVYEKSLEYNNEILIITLISVALLIIMSIYLLVAAGHKKGHNEIYLNRFDKLPFDLILVITTIVITVLVVIVAEANYATTYDSWYKLINISIVGFVLLAVYGILALVGTTFIKKIKSKTLIKTTLIYIILKKIIDAIKEITGTISKNIDISVKLVLGFIILVGISFILCMMFSIFGLFLGMLLWAYVLFRIIKEINKFRKIKNAIKNIYEGNNEIRLDTNEFNGELREISTHINDIAGGFSNAIEETLKSERLKTELITNVSHDIKTPLTSIINYVDLLKKENIEGEKANEYIQVLENKSQRLKKLTEDLVEAAKASSGNIKLNIETINVIELLKQTIGEFDEKFREKDLKLNLNFLETEEINIKADSRYMYRITENIFSNITKYALENSRVYIDVITSKNTAKISFKNISKEPLNITADELMERFVRGDQSRTTEGSGLGLSISKSLTEIQQGKFNISIDGDLFKIELEFQEL